jgi:hypothetical protein
MYDKPILQSRIVVITVTSAYTHHVAIIQDKLAITMQLEHCLLAIHYDHY